MSKRLRFSGPLAALFALFPIAAPTAAPLAVPELSAGAPVKSSLKKSDLTDHWGHPFRCYAIKTRVGQHYHVTMASGAYSPSLAVGQPRFDGDDCRANVGVYSGGNNDDGAHVDFDGDGGVWYVRAVGQYHRWGGFTLQVTETTTPPTERRTIRPGETLPGALKLLHQDNVGRPSDCFVIASEKPHKNVTVEWRSLSVDFTATVFRGQGCDGLAYYTAIVGEGKSDYATLNVANGRTYSFRVTSFHPKTTGRAFGTYEVSLSAADETSMSSGAQELVSGKLVNKIVKTKGVAADAYWMAGAAGTRASIVLEGSGTFEVAVYGNHAARPILDPVRGEGRIQVKFPFSETDAYLVVVRRTSQSGDYTISANLSDPSPAEYLAAIDGGAYTDRDSTSWLGDLQSTVRYRARTSFDDPTPWAIRAIGPNTLAVTLRLSSGATLRKNVEVVARPDGTILGLWDGFPELVYDVYRPAFPVLSLEPKTINWDLP